MPFIALLFSVLTPALALAQVFGPPAPRVSGQYQVVVHDGSGGTRVYKGDNDDTRSDLDSNKPGCGNGRDLNGNCIVFDDGSRDQKNRGAKNDGYDPYGPGYSNDDGRGSSKSEYGPGYAGGNDNRSNDRYNDGYDMGPMRPMGPPPPPPEPSQADQKACREAHVKVGYKAKLAEKYCKLNARAEKVLSPNFGECVADLKKVSTASADLTPFCFWLDKAQTTQKTLKCIADTAPVVKESFWYLEDVRGMGAVTEFTSQLQAPFNMRELFHECAHPVQDSLSKNAKVVGLTAYNSFLGVPNLAEGLGGLSGLTRKGANEIWSITDSKDHPVIHKFTFDLKQNPTRVDFHYTGFSELKSAGADSDFEDLYLLPSGELLASTEVVSEAGRHGIFGRATPPSLLVKFNAKLDKPIPIDVPDELIPVTSTKEIPCPPVTPPSFPDLSKAEEKKKQAQWVKDFSSFKCWDNNTKGIQFNKGLEGMSFDVASNSVFFAPEQPLSQHKPDFDGRGELPFYRAKLESDHLGQTDRFTYSINTSDDTGISAMLALNHDDVLVLERGFSQTQRRAIMKLYKIHLGDSSPAKALEKKLLIDFDGLRAQVPAGFQNLDNFEGIALGPKLANGKRILFFVSDDNFNAAQKTLMMTLEVGGLE